VGPALLIDPSIWRRARVQSRKTRLISNSIGEFGDVPSYVEIGEQALPALSR